MALTKLEIFGLLKERGLDTAYTNDIWNKQQINHALENNLVDDDVRSSLEGSINIDPIGGKPGEFTSQLKELSNQYRTEDKGSAADNLRRSTLDFDVSQLYKKSSGNDVGDIFNLQAPEFAVAENVEQPEDNGFKIWGNIRRGLENNFGLAKLMGGMVANGLGVESIGEALKASAQNNFMQAEKFAKSESFEEDPLAWAGQVVLEGVPDIAMTLLSGGAAGLAAGGIKMLGGKAAKEAIKTSLEASLRKGLKSAAMKGEVEAMSMQAIEETVKAAVKDDVIDSITSVGLRDAFTSKGRKAFAGEAVKKLGVTGVSREALEEAVLKGARGRALTSTSTAAAAGSFTWGALTTDGDIAKDLYDEAGRLREERVKQLVDQKVPEAQAIEQAKKEITDPTLGDLGVGGFIAPMTDMFVPYMVGKQLGIFKGSKVSSVARELASSDAGKKILKSLPAAIANGAVPEGFTEMVQGAMAESAKKDFIDQWKTMGLTKEQELGWVDYMLRPEAKARYLAEFAGGALMGGVMGGIANKVEGWREGGEPKVEPIADTPEVIEKKSAFLTNMENYKDELIKNNGFSLDEQGNLDNYKKVSQNIEKLEKAIPTKTKGKKQLTAEEQEQAKADLEQRKTDAKSLLISSQEQLVKGEAKPRKLTEAEQTAKQARADHDAATDPEVRAKKLDLLLMAERNLAIEKTKYDRSKPIMEINKEILEIETKYPAGEVRDAALQDAKDRKQKALEKALNLDEAIPQAEASAGEITKGREADAVMRQEAKALQDRRVELKTLETLTPQEKIELDYLDFLSPEKSLTPEAKSSAAADAISIFKQGFENVPQEILAQVNDTDLSRIVAEAPENAELGAFVEKVRADRAAAPMAEATPTAEPVVDLEVEPEVDLGIQETMTTAEGPVALDLETPAPVAEAVAEQAPFAEEPAPRKLVVGPPRGATKTTTPAPTQTTPAAPVVSNRKTDPRKPRTPVTARAIEYLDASDADPESQASEEAANEFRKTLNELKAREGLEVSDAEAINTLVDRGVLDVTRQDRARLQNLVTKFALPTADQVTQGTTIEQLNAWLSSNKPGFLAKSTVKVVTSEKYPGKRWQGAYSNGVIYLNADTMTEADMKRVLFHEALGHAIAREVLGKDYDSVMKTILREMQAVIAGGKDVMVGNTSMKDLIATYKDKLGDPAVAEEVWAKYIEAHAEGKLTNKSTLFKIYEAIRDWVIKAMGGELRTLSAVDRLAARAVRRAEFNQIDMSEARMGEAMALTVERPKATPVTDERATRDASRILGIKLPRMFLESKLLGELETAFKKTDVNWFDKLLRPSQWIAEKMFQEVPQLRKMFQVLTNMSDRHREIFNQLSFHALPYLKARKTDKIAVEKVLVQGDIDGVEYTTAQEAKLTAEQFKQYQSARTALNKARDHMVADAERAIAAMEERIKGQENIVPIIQKHIDELKTSVSSLKKMKGYIPRVRPDSAPYDIQYMLDGKIHSDFIDVKGTPGIRVAERRIKELVAKGAQPIGGKDKIEVLERPANYYDQSSLSPTEIGELSNILASVMKDKEGKSLEGVDDLLKSLFYAKGFKKHYIRRQKAKLSKEGVEIATGSSEVELDNGETVIHGYQTDNLDVVLRDYFQGLAGQSAKSETSMKLMEIFEERDAEGDLVFDPSKAKRAGAYKVAKDFLKAAKMAGNDYSKTVRRVNAIQFHAHIGLRFSSALWNMTHIHMFGSGLLRTEMMKAGKKDTPSFLDMSKQFAVAHKDAMVFIKAIKPKLETTADAKVTLEEMGWGQDKAKVLDAMNQYFAAANGSTLSEQIYSESFGKDAGVPQSMMAQYTKYSGWMMHHSELANKLASFQMHYQNMGGNYDEAKHFVRLLNGSYEKFNMPGYLQGEGMGSAAFQIMLNTFRTHVLNTYEIMGSMWKYDKAAFAYSMGAATIMAGVPGKMLLDMLVRLIWGVSEGEDQFKGSYERMNEDLFGPGVAKFMKGGVANWMDFVDPSASIGISQHPTVDALSYLTGHNREIALAAPFTGFIKAMNGEAPAYKLMPIKGIQSIFQSLSDSNQVQIGSRKIFNSDGTPMKLATWESALVAAGINPASRAQTSGDIWEDYQVNEFFSSWKSSILNDAKDARSLYERAEVNKQMTEFNDQLAVVNRNPTYTNVVKAKPIRWADTKRSRGEYTKTERGQ